jgi:hypothetical protein
MSGFEETEFGSRKVVRAAVSPVGEERARERKAEEGRGGRRKAEEGRGKKASKRSQQKKSGTKQKAGGRKPKKQSSKRPNQVDPSGSGVLVPLDQWTRVLNQLGNLHEAGQQIADARERAAKAETEAAFLRERLKEMRAELEVMKRTDPGGR